MSGNEFVYPHIPIEIREWVYPDSIDKMVMNELVNTGYMSAKNYLDVLVIKEFDLQAIIIEALDFFEGEGYVTSALVEHPEDVDEDGQPISYKVYTVTDFFTLKLTEYRLMEAEAHQAKIDLWNAQQAELPPHERFDPNATPPPPIY